MKSLKVKCDKLSYSKLDQSFIEMIEGLRLTDKLTVLIIIKDTALRSHEFPVAERKLRLTLSTSSTKNPFGRWSKPKEELCSITLKHTLYLHD